MVRLRDVGGAEVVSATAVFGSGNQAWPPASPGWLQEDTDFLGPVPSSLGRSVAGPENMHFQTIGHSFIPASVPGTLGGTGKTTVREKNQLLPFGPFK